VTHTSHEKIDQVGIFIAIKKAYPRTQSKHNFVL